MTPFMEVNASELSRLWLSSPVDDGVPLVHVPLGFPVVDATDAIGAACEAALVPGLEAQIFRYWNVVDLADMVAAVLKTCLSELHCRILR